MTPLVVVGELTADGTSLVLVADGPEHELARAAAQLQTLTPLVKSTKPPGGLIMPISWAAVIQLVRTLGPAWRTGPALSAWLADQVRRRMAPPTELAVTPPAGLTPRSYQTAGACLIAATGRVLIFDEPRTGKTVTTALGLVERAAAGHPVLPVVVVCPAAVIDPWVEHINRWTPWRAVAWRGTPRARRRLEGTAEVYVTSYETCRVDAGETTAPLCRLGAQFLVVDECLPAGTPIDTPDGPRPIESLRVGDLVIGIDHQTGLPVTTPVRHTFANQTAAELVSVRGVEMTPEHPVWTAERGYVPAAEVLPSDTVCSVVLKYSHEGDHHVRVVREAVREGRLPEQAEQGAFLRPDVFGPMANVPAGVRGEAEHAQASCCIARRHGEVASAPGRAGEAHSAPARGHQPLPRSCGASQGTTGGAGGGLPGVDGRERHGPHSAAGIALRSAGLAGGDSDSDRSGQALPHVVQGRYRLAGAADSCRGGWAESPQPGSAGARREERRTAHRVGLDGAALPERPDRQGSGCGSGRGVGRRAVYNIETGTGNYVAGGLLVHNCHKIKDRSTVQAKAVRRLARNTAGMVGLSGTPITHSPGDLWPALDAMEPGAWPSRERWIARYCDSVAGDYASKVIGLRTDSEAEFRQALLGQYRRVARADVLNELPKVHSVRLVELPPEYRAAYDSMESDMLAELPDGGQLSAMGVLAKLTRLSQLASAAADVRVTTETVEVDGFLLERRHQHVTLKAPSWKVDELLAIMAERPDYAIAVFAPSKQLITLAGEAAAKAGHRVGYVVGGQTAAERTDYVRAFQARELDLLCATTGAGGTGLTLSSADTVVFLQRPWSLVESLQAEDRAEGDESKARGTEVIDVVARNTIDTRVRAVLRERAGQLAELVQDPRIVAELLGGAGVRDLRKAS